MGVQAAPCGWRGRTRRRIEAERQPATVGKQPPPSPPAGATLAEAARPATLPSHRVLRQAWCGRHALYRVATAGGARCGLSIASAEHPPPSNVEENPPPPLLPPCAPVSLGWVLMTFL